MKTYPKGPDAHDPMDSPYWLGKMRQRDLECAKLDRGDVTVLECRHCGWYWRPRKAGKKPEFCPNCQKRRWE